MSHYDTLGVARDASAQDIKAAFRKLAAEHHPDRGGDVERMQAINQAFDILGNAEKRAMYDETGGTMSIAEAAQSMLAQLFEQYLERDKPLLQAVREHIAHEAAHAKSDQGAFRQKVAKLEKRRERINRSSDNIVHRLIDAKLAPLRSQIDQAEKFQRLCFEALAQLETYSSTEGEAPAGRTTLDGMSAFGGPLHSMFNTRMPR